MPKPKSLFVVAFEDAPIEIEWITRKGKVVRRQTLTLERDYFSACPDCKETIPHYTKATAEFANRVGLRCPECDARVAAEEVFRDA